MKTYLVRKADLPRDQSVLLGVLKRNLPAITEERYLWNLENLNPGSVQRWLAEEVTSGQVVGCNAVFYREIYVDGQPLKAGIAGDFAVDREHRAFGPALALQKAVLSSLPDLGIGFLYGIPTPNSELLVLKLGYARLGPMLKLAKIFRSEYKENTFLPCRPLTRRIAKILDWMIRLVSRENRYRRPPGYSVETPEAFDQRFDALWEKTKRQIKIAGKRDAGFLTWRYAKSPIRKYQVFAFLNPQKEIAGYIVYYLLENVCRIADLLTLDLNASLDGLLAEFLLHLRAQNVGSVTVRYMGNPALVVKLKKYNFFLQARKQEPVVIALEKNPAHGTLLQNSANWHFFEGDNDC